MLLGVRCWVLGIAVTELPSAFSITIAVLELCSENLVSVPFRNQSTVNGERKSTLPNIASCRKSRSTDPGKEVFWAASRGWPPFGRKSGMGTGNGNG